MDWARAGPEPGQNRSRTGPSVLQVLQLQLKAIRSQQDLLFRFLNFLKQEGAVHVLQFCLAAGKALNAQPGPARFRGPV